MYGISFLAVIEEVHAIERKVLVIDDDLEVYKEIRKILQGEEVFVEFIPGYDLVEQMNRSEICLAIINLRFLEDDFFNLIRKIRLTKSTPILALASNANANVKRIDVFRAGAHGYLEYPYTTEECAAYVKSLIDLYWKLQKNEKQGGALIFEPDFLIDPVRHQAVLNETTLDLTPKEFELLYCLASYAGQVLSREQLFNAVWNEYAAFNVDELVKAHIKSLRKKLFPYGKEYIQNVRGVGYRFTLERKQP